MAVHVVDRMLGAGLLKAVQQAAKQDGFVGGQDWKLEGEEAAPADLFEDALELATFHLFTKNVRATDHDATAAAIVNLADELDHLAAAALVAGHHGLVGFVDDQQHAIIER